jgi:hypothetical protein
MSVKETTSRNLEGFLHFSDSIEYEKLFLEYSHSVYLYIYAHTHTHTHTHIYMDVRLAGA